MPIARCGVVLLLWTLITAPSVSAQGVELSRRQADVAKSSEPSAARHQAASAARDLAVALLKQHPRLQRCDPSTVQYLRLEVPSGGSQPTFTFVSNQRDLLFMDGSKRTLMGWGHYRAGEVAPCRVYFSVHRSTKDGRPIS